MVGIHITVEHGFWNTTIFWALTIQIEKEQEGRNRSVVASRRYRFHMWEYLYDYLWAKDGEEVLPPHLDDNDPDLVRIKRVFAVQKNEIVQSIPLIMRYFLYATSGKPHISLVQRLNSACSLCERNYLAPKVYFVMVESIRKELYTWKVLFRMPAFTHILYISPNAQLEQRALLVYWIARRIWRFDKLVAHLIVKWVLCPVEDFDTACERAMRCIMRQCGALTRYDQLKDLPWNNALIENIKNDL